MGIFTGKFQEKMQELQEITGKSQKSQENAKTDAGKLDGRS